MLRTRSRHAARTSSSRRSRRSRVLFVEPLETRTVPSFLPPTHYLVGSSPLAMAAADFNRDGRPDLAVTSIFATRGRVGVHLNHGDGTFRSPVHYHDLSLGTAGDFNDDGNPDLAVMLPHTTFGYVRLGVLRGNGDGTFQDVVASGITRSSRGVATGDFNGDGRLDLVMGHNHGSPITGSVSVLLGNGDGSFQDPVTLNRSRGVDALAVSDFNRDGHADLAVSNGNEGAGVLLGRGDGSFQYILDLEADFLRDLIVSDFNGDGQPDLALARDLLRNHVSVWLGGGDGTFRSAGDFGVDNGPSRLAVADLNGDRVTDLVTANLAGTASVLLGRSDGLFGVALHYRVDALAYNPDLAADDFNGDGFPDLAMTTPLASDSVAVLLNTTATEVPADLAGRVAPADSRAAALADAVVPLPADTAAVDMLFLAESEEDSWLTPGRSGKRMPGNAKGPSWELGLPSS